MNSIDVKLEKANAIFRYRRLQNLTTLFRFMEIFVFLIVISRFFFSQLPFAVRVSADHFRGISFAVFSPRFVFVIGNVIIVILFFKSRAVENEDRNEKVDVYEECVKNCEKIVNTSSTATTVTTTVIVPSKKRKLCRSQSENLMIVNCKVNQTHQNLRRSVTAKHISKKIDRGGGETAVQEKSCAADELTGEEFRRTVEAFIAKQQKSLRDEELTG